MVSRMRISRTSNPVIRNPEMTLNTSTPMKPPPKPGTWTWNSSTAITAIARMPSMSGRNSSERALVADKIGAAPGRRDTVKGVPHGRPPSTAIVS